MQLPASPRAARRFFRRIDLRTVAPPRARSAAPPSGMMYATSLAILGPIEARPPPRWPETSYFCRPFVPASAPVARLLPAPDASRELLVPRASAFRSGDACEAARGRWVAAGCRFLLVSRRLRVSPLSGAAPTSECLGAGHCDVTDLILAHGRPSSPSPSPLHARRSSAAPAIQLQTAVFRASYRRAALGTRLEH